MPQTQPTTQNAPITIPTIPATGNPLEEELLVESTPEFWVTVGGVGGGVGDGFPHT